mgnify:CR=1 FL=1
MTVVAVADVEDVVSRGGFSFNVTSDFPLVVRFSLKSFELPMDLGFFSELSSFVEFCLALDCALSRSL